MPSSTDTPDDIIRKRSAEDRPIRKRLWLPEPFEDIPYTTGDDEDEDEDDAADTR